MLRLSLSFLVLALIAAVLGFSNIAIVSVEIAKFLFLLFLVLFIISLVFGIFLVKKSKDKL